jgi:ribokinase
VSAPRVGVVGHLEWVDFALVDRLPAAGEILPARGGFRHAAGGGGVAAVQLRRMAGAAFFLTAAGDDADGEQALAELRDRWGVDVHAAVRDAPQRRAFTHLDGTGERTITVVGDRHVPHGDDALPWDRLDACDAVYFTGGDVEALRRSRAARVVVATPRGRAELLAGGVEVDMLVASGTDEGEPTDGIPAKVVVLTEGSGGGRWSAADGSSGRWAPAEVPGPPVDAYGCGDSFAAGLTGALGAGRRLEDALAFAARCGAWCLAGRGPYGHEMPSLG